MSDQSTANSAAQGPEDDTLLDRMVEPEYAAISVKAILSLILAGISALALLPSPLYLSFPGIGYGLPLLIVLPLVALAASVAALRSIRRSEGTLVGLRAATLAAGLSAAFVIGSIGLHGYTQYREKQLHRTLLEATQRHLELMMQEKYEPVYLEMAANNPRIAEKGPTLNQWSSRIKQLMTTGGDYYGRDLHRHGIKKPEDPTEGTDPRGQVVYRFRFKRGGVDLSFVFRDSGQGWKLMGVGANGVAVFPRRGDQPKKRYEK